MTRPPLIFISLTAVLCWFAACAVLQTNNLTTEPTAILTTGQPETDPVSLSPTPTPVPPTITPARMPSTPILTESFTLATSAEEIAGTWHEGNRYYLRFDEDGTFRQAYALDKLDSRPYAISSYWFEGTEMVTTEVSVSGVPSCGDKIGRYEIRMLRNGYIQIVTITDPWPPRANDISGVKTPAEGPTPEISVGFQDGLVAFFSFDGGANDISGNGNQGTVHGAILTTDCNGERGIANAFDGLPDYISVMVSPGFDVGDGDWKGFPLESSSSLERSMRLGFTTGPFHWRRSWK